MLSQSMTACSGDGLPDIDLSSDLSVIWIQSLFVDTALNMARANAQHVRGKLKIHMFDEIFSCLMFFREAFKNLLLPFYSCFILATGHNVGCIQ